MPSLKKSLAINDEFWYSVFKLKICFYKNTGETCVSFGAQLDQICMVDKYRTKKQFETARIYGN